MSKTFWSQLPAFDIEVFIGELRLLRITTHLLKEVHIPELTRLRNLMDPEGPGPAKRRKYGNWEADQIPGQEADQIPGQEDDDENDAKPVRNVIGLLRLVSKVLNGSNFLPPHFV